MYKPGHQCGRQRQHVHLTAVGMKGFDDETLEV